MGKVTEAEKWMTTALALAQQTENPDIIANAFLNTATVYSQTQRLDKAIPYAQRITAMYDSLGTPEKSVKALVTLGNIFVQLPKYDKALEYYSEALELNPRMPQALNNIAVIYHYLGEQLEEAGKAEEAEAYFDQAADYWQRAIRQAPNNYIEAQNWLKTTGRSKADIFF